MFALKERKDNFRFQFPQDFIVDEINDKYARILQQQRSFFYKPVDFLNETIKSVQVLGFNDATFMQQQPGYGNNLRDPERTKLNKFSFSASDQAYRSELNPLQLLDKTFNVTFRHTLGFVNYFLMFENFWYIFHRDTSSKEAKNVFTVDFLDGYGRAYSRVVMEDPLINGIDMLSLDYSQPIASSETFQVTFKYSNIDYQIIEVNDEDILNVIE